MTNNFTFYQTFNATTIRKATVLVQPHPPGFGEGPLCTRSKTSTRTRTWRWRKYEECRAGREWRRPSSSSTGVPSKHTLRRSPKRWLALRLRQTSGWQWSIEGVFSTAGILSWQWDSEIRRYESKPIISCVNTSFVDFSFWALTLTHEIMKWAISLRWHTDVVMQYTSFKQVQGCASFANLCTKRERSSTWSFVNLNLSDYGLNNTQI